MKMVFALNVNKRLRKMGNIFERGQKRYGDNPYLDKIREENKQRVEKCYYCENKSEYFDCIEYKVISVCKKHFNFNTAS